MLMNVPKKLLSIEKMESEIVHACNASNWHQSIRKGFDFENGEGIVQLNLRHLFTRVNCEEIYQNFTFNNTSGFRLLCCILYAYTE